MEIDELRETRRRRLQALLRSGRFTTQAEFADIVGTADSSISRQLRGAKNVGEVLARRWEKILGLERGWFDRPVDGPIDVEEPTMEDQRDHPPESDYAAIIAKRVAALDEGVQLAVLNLVETFLGSMKESSRGPDRPIRRRRGS